MGRTKKTQPARWVVAEGVDGRFGIIAMEGPEEQPNFTGLRFDTQEEADRVVRSPYQRTIAETLLGKARTDLRHRHVEALVRCYHPTLNHLTLAQLRREALRVLPELDALPNFMRDSLARCWGL